MNRNLSVALFVLVGLGLFLAGLFTIGNRHQAFAKHLVIYTEFANLSGLAKGAKVQVAGMDAGRVEEIRVPDSPSSRFRLKIQLDEKFHGLVRSNSLATITTAGVVGDTFVLIRRGTEAAPEINPEGLLESRQPTELADLLDQAKTTISDVDTTVRNANGLLSSAAGNVNATIRAAHETIGDVDNVVRGIKRGEGTAGLIIRNPALADYVRQTVLNTQQATQNLRDASAKADSLIADVAARNFPQRIDETIMPVRDAATKIDEASEGVRRTVADLTAPDQQGKTAGTNLREALSSGNEAAGKFSEDTEALKHNFLLRAFFRRRGYYSLTGISPVVYRKEQIFTSIKNLRAWLQASSLFRANGNGEAELTPNGKVLIDSAVNQLGDSLEGSPIMVEGYERDGDLANKITVSQERAVLVSRYIRGRYHLSVDNIGAIGLTDLPPQKSGETAWDGICIVLVRSAR
jgi:phospholipid/cholesterol/gamma-HCH transport system substrate-binding protein